MTDTLKHAVRDYKIGNLVAAESGARRTIVDDPANGAAHNILALVHLAQGDDAISPCRRALRLAPANEVFLANLGTIRATVGASVEALGTYERLVSLSPGSTTALTGRANCQRLVGDFTGAWKNQRRAVLLAPEDGLARWNLGAYAVEGGRISAAPSVYRGVAVLSPGEARAWAEIGRSLLALGDIGRAVEAFTRALILDPRHAEAQRGRLRACRARFAADRRLERDLPGGLFIRGPLNGVSGYGHMAGGFVRTLAARGLRLNLGGILGDESWTSPIDLPLRPAVSLNFLTPSTFEPVPGLPSGIFSMFEGTRMPPSWIEPCGLADLVIVPTVSSKEAWMARGFPEDRLRVCPLGVDEETPGTPPFVMRDAAGRSFADRARRILNVSDFIPRKNVDGLLRVWLRSTTEQDDAVLILKLGKGKPGDREQIRHLIALTEQSVGKTMAQAAPVVFIDKAISEEQMSGLFWMSTHYFSLSHGEGWDLPLSRAGALGLGLIAPAHSAYLDYLDDTVARMIPAVPGPAHLPYSREPWPPFHGIDWWNPDEDAAAEILTNVVRGRDTVPLDAKTRLLTRFTWKQATGRLLQVLGELKDFPSLCPISP
jgi:Flp pilus assembly protein TadD